MGQALAKALHAFQAEATTLQKDAINPHFRSKYLALDSLMEQVLPLLNKHGLVVLQWPTALERETHLGGGPAGVGVVKLGTVPALRTKLIHAESGESMEDVMPLMLAKDDPQGLGSALTYARRYSLMSILALVADVDDDGNAASPRRTQTQTTHNQTPTAASAAAAGQTPDF